MVISFHKLLCIIISYSQEEKECRAELSAARATLMVYEEKLSNVHQGRKEHMKPVVVSQEIQTDTQVTEANSPAVDTSMSANVSEQDVTDRIHQEKEKLGEMMEDLRLRILELEESRKMREEEAILDEEQRQGPSSNMELGDTLEVGQLCKKNYACICVKM